MISDTRTEQKSQGWLVELIDPPRDLWPLLTRWRFKPTTESRIWRASFTDPAKAMHAVDQARRSHLTGRMVKASTAAAARTQALPALVDKKPLPAPANPDLGPKRDPLGQLVMSHRVTA